MSPVSASELASIRADLAAAACDLACTIKRPTETKDVYGSNTESFTTVATTTAGMREPTAGQLQNYAYLIGSLATWQVQLPYGADVQRLDHLTINGQEMIVQVDLSPQSLNGLTTVLATAVK